MNSPAILSLFSLFFILLGCFNVFSGSKRIREAHSRGIILLWYKQINILIGIEYILLALVFLVSTLLRSKAIPAAFNGLIFPLYLVLLIASAILAGLVIRQGILNARTIRAQSRSTSTVTSNGTTKMANQSGTEKDSGENAASLNRRRERRRNAAAARRRRAGKA